ncbi:MAG TPA: deaminase [Streptosporangiaceae bacterium]|nr:deaminase [Streptosporangiaceae bacterium]
MELDGAWQRALEQAWQSYLAGTTPVGAVVVDSVGDIVAEGRGRRYENAAGGRQLAYCHIAHAEVNALALLPPGRHYEDHVLLTTLEPCCMCVGAAVQATFTRVHFAGRDPYAGASELVVDTPQARRRPLAVTGPLPGLPGRFAELLHVRWLLDFRAAEPVIDVQRRALPEIYQAAVDPVINGLFGQFRAGSATLEDAMAASRELLRA